MTKIVYENPWFRVLNDGQWFWVDEPKAQHTGGVLLVLDGREIVLVKAKRRLHGGIELEIPRGYNEPGETSFDCAKRELREETGFEIPISRIRKLGTIIPNSGILSTQLDIFLAEGTRADLVADSDDEVEGILILTFAEFREKIAAGEIRDACTLSAYSLLIADGNIDLE